MRVLCFRLASVRNEIEVPIASSVLLVDLPPGKRSPELWLRSGTSKDVTRRVYWVVPASERPPCSGTRVGTAMALSDAASGDPLSVLHVYEEAGA